jgi:hypothetical protein
MKETGHAGNRGPNANQEIGVPRGGIAEDICRTLMMGR